MPALETRNVSYCRSGFALVQRVSLCADRGELLVLVGPPGSGTHTLLRVLAGELTPDAGRVVVDGIGASGFGSWPQRVDPRAFAHGPDHAAALLADPGDRSVLLLDRPTTGLAPERALELLDRCRRRAADGYSVVATLDDVRSAARYAHTLAMLVAGRLVAWGSPAVALFPALRVLGYQPPARDQVLAAMIPALATP